MAKRDFAKVEELLVELFSVQVYRKETDKKPWLFLGLMTGPEKQEYMGSSHPRNQLFKQK